MQEQQVDTLSLTAAQRYSVLVTAQDEPSANWAIHANMDTDMFDTVPDALQPSRSCAHPHVPTPPLIALLDITTSVTYSAGASITDSGFIDNYDDVPDVELVPLEVEPGLL